MSFSVYSLNGTVEPSTFWVREPAPKADPNPEEVLLLLMLDPNPPKDEGLTLVVVLFWPKGLLLVLDPKAFPELEELKENPLPPVLDPNALDELLLFWPKTLARPLLLLLLLLAWPKIDPELLDPKVLPDD